MKMTKKEYKLFLSKYELLGQLEYERKNEEPISLEFLDEIQYLVNTNKQISHIKSRLNTKILVRKTLNRLSQNAFDQI